MATKLDSGQKRLLQLVVEGADAEGWAAVSKPVFPLVEKLPNENLLKNNGVHLYLMML